MQIARIVREARRGAGLTQRQLAERAGVPQSTVARIESGGIGPRWATVEGLLRASGAALELEREAGHGVDRSQIRDLLRLTPLERARLAVADAAGMAAIIRVRR